MILKSVRLACITQLPMPGTVVPKDGKDLGKLRATSPPGSGMKIKVRIAIITHFTYRVEAKIRPGGWGWDRYSSAKVRNRPCC